MNEAHSVTHPYTFKTLSLEMVSVIFPVSAGLQAKVGDSAAQRVDSAYQAMNPSLRMPSI